MSLVEIPVRQLHQGVSRQPDHARFPGQLQDASNCIFRVEDAGFSKRFGSTLVAPVDASLGTSNIKFEVLDFFANSKLGISIGNGNISICDLLTGAQRVVNPLSAEALAYLGTDASQLVISLVYGTALILNRSVKVAMRPVTSAPVATNKAVFHVIDGRPGKYSITIDGQTATASPTTSDQSTWDTSIIAGALAVPLGTALGSAYTVEVPQGGYILVSKNDGTSMAVSSQDPTGGQSIRTTVADTYITNTDLLPAFALNGMRVFVGAASAASYYVKFVETGGGRRGYWTECLGPSVSYSIDPTTMPHAISINADQSFTFQQAVWGDLQVGDNSTVPPPDFVGQTITDIVFHKNRLALLTGEWVWFSTAGDYFNFWPKYSTQALDTDPFCLRGSANRQSYQRFGVPYRKVFWTTADIAQFEISTATTLTEKNTVMDYTTGYVCNPLCRPVVMAQMLYFTSWNGGSAVLEEYSFDYFTLTSVANDVTRHVRSYIPSQIFDMTADQPTGNLFMLSSSDPSSIYCWTVYWNMTQREQNCWSAWNFPGCTIHGIRVAAGILYMCITRPGYGTWIEKIPLGEQDSLTGFPYSPRLDQMELVTGGAYDAVNDRTPFALSIPAAGMGGVLQGSGATLQNCTGVGNTLYASGNHQGQNALVGSQFNCLVTLSKQFLRDQQGTSILNGVLQLQTMTVAHKDTGSYQVEIDVPGRAPIIQTYYQNDQISTGTFRGTVQGDGQTATIKISNPIHLPHTITEIVFRGEFNELVRQG